MRNRAIWLMPLGIGVAVLALSTQVVAVAIAVVVAIALLVYFVRRPGFALIALIVFLPLETIVFALLLTWHVPASILKPASGIKELLAFAILLAALVHMRAVGQRLDRIDIALLVYVAVVTLYLAVPHLFSSVAPTEWNVRLLAWRSDAGYPLLFFGARHAPIPPRYKDRFIQVLLIMGALVAFLALFQRLAAATWSDFILNTANVPAYQGHVIGLQPNDVLNNLRYLITIHPLRVSSLFLSPFDLGDYLVLVSAVAGVRISRNYRSIFPYVVLGSSLAAIFFSGSRSDALATLVILLLIALPISRSPVEGRLRLIGFLALAAVVVVPALGGSRYLGAQGGSASATGHLTEIRDGLNVLDHHPLGLGLGDQPSTAARSIQTAHIIYGGNVSDNSILQVGDELGVQALIPWLAMMGLVLWEFKRRGRNDPFAMALGFGLLGIIIAGLYHHVFLTYPVPWTLWSGAGLALSVHRAPYEPSAATNVSVAGVP
jgi:hypothetical protein